MKRVLRAFLILATLLSATVLVAQLTVAHFDHQSRVFRLDGGNVTYAFGVNSRGELQWPGASAEELSVLTPQPAQPHDGASVILPVNWWNNGEFKDQLNLDTMQFTTLAQMFAADATTPKAREYISPDGSVFLPAGRVFQQGPATNTSGWRFSDDLDTYGFLVAKPGQRVYVSSESEDITYSARVNPDGTLANLKPFAQRGGEGVAVDSHGNVYVANGQIFVYSPAGKHIAQIDVPERPLQLVFGGANGKTLFILAHHALFAVAVR